MYSRKLQTHIREEPKTRGKQAKQELQGLLNLLGVKEADDYHYGNDSLVMEYAGKRDADRSYRTLKALISQEQPGQKFSRKDVKERLHMLGLDDLPQVSEAWQDTSVAEQVLDEMNDFAKAAFEDDF